MLNSSILSQSRKAANDNDSSNPFHTDAQIYFFVDNWGIDLARYLRYPRRLTTLSFAIDDGGSATSKDMDTDTLSVLSVTLAPASGSNYIRLKPKTEAEMDQERPSWRDTSQGSGKPKYYVIRDTILVSTSNYPQKKITTDRPLDEAMTMRINGIVAPAPLGSTGTNSPALPPEFHITGVYYAAWQMMLPRNADRAEYFRRLYESERRRIKSQWAEFIDSNTEVWDNYEVW